MLRTWGVILIGALVLSGCATLNKEECLTADWYQIGYEDGARGYSDTRIASHREACAKHGISPDFRSYQDGHSEGVIRFCTPRNGFDQGTRGYQYTGICPPSLEGEFLDAYDAGREIYAVQSSIRELRSEQNRNESQISRLQDDIAAAEQALFSAETSEEDKRNIYDRIGRMQEELGSLEQRNKQLVVDIAQAEAKLRVLEEKYAYY
ncbi:DUF2799 domain-containing protein [Reinekea blandensis]|nr:DUF2799 domain-containing protein [Reinekea blandensis]